MLKLLPYLERVLLAILLVGYALKFIGIDIPILISISLAGLGIVFFLSAFKPFEIKLAEGELLGLKELFGLQIAPKVLWISTAVATLGVLFYTLQLGNDGYKQMLMIGASSIAIGSIVLLGSKAAGVKYINMVLPVLFRSIPTLLVSVYILFG